VALNARLPEKRIREYCKLGGSAAKLLIRAQKQLRISARGRSHILRVARTIADLEGAEAISDDHIGEAIQYRKRVVGP
jgi:magnesium chelatase family protein